MNEVTRAEFEQRMRRRVAAIDAGLTAMMLAVIRELPDDPEGVDAIRHHVAAFRTKLCVLYPFAVDLIGRHD
jgi:hypothetical protein